MHHEEWACIYWIILILSVKGKESAIFSNLSWKCWTYLPSGDPLAWEEITEALPYFSTCMLSPTCPNRKWGMLKIQLPLWRHRWAFMWRQGCSHTWLTLTMKKKPHTSCFHQHNLPWNSDNLPQSMMGLIRAKQRLVCYCYPFIYLHSPSQSQCSRRRLALCQTTTLHHSD